MHKSLRYLRIIWTAFCGIACVLLIVLWVRSYWKTGSLNYFSEARIRGIYSSYGVIRLFYATDERIRLGGRSPVWRAYSQWNNDPALNPEEQAVVRRINSKQFRWVNRMPSSFSANAPYWLITLLIAASGVVPWFRWRFSLRTLLITITLFAIMLGVVVYLFHQSDTKPAPIHPSPWLF